MTATPELPPEWGASTVGEEFTVQLGKMLDAAKNRGEPRPYLGNAEVQWGRLRLEELPLVRLSPADMKKYRLQKGDLLVCEGGEVGRAAIWEEDLAECYYQKALHRLRPRRGYDPKIMAAFLRLWSDNRALANYVTQTSIAHLPRERLIEIPLPVPPVPEQRAIAAALSDADALVAALDALIAKKRAMKQGAMQQLLTGKTRLPGFTGEWKHVKLGTILTFHRPATNSRADLAADGDLGYLHYGDVHAHPTPFLDLDRTPLPRVARSRITVTTRLQDGDLVLVDASEDLEGLGKSVEITNLGEREIVPGLHTITARGEAGAWAPGYKAYLQFMPEFRRAITRAASGISVYATSKRHIADVVMPLPDSDEQRAIVEVLRDVEAEITALILRREKAKMVKHGMMQALLTGRVRLPGTPEVTA